MNRQAAAIVRAGALDRITTYLKTAEAELEKAYAEASRLEPFDPELATEVTHAIITTQRARKQAEGT